MRALWIFLYRLYWPLAAVVLVVGGGAGLAPPPILVGAVNRLDR